MKKMIDNPLLDLPYFPVEPCAKNSTVVYLLQTCYSGKHSALTAMLQYFSNAQQCRQWQEDALAEKFVQMAHIKLIHLDLLAQLLTAYGGGVGFHQATPYGMQPWSVERLTHYPSLMRLQASTKAREQATLTHYRKLLAHLPEAGNQAVVERMLTDLQVLAN